MNDDLLELPPDAFARADASRDGCSTPSPASSPISTTGAIAAVTALYRRLFPPGGAILDLMSSWVSHLPEEVAYAEVVGHGLNRAELAANPRLTRFFVQDLNEDRSLPLADGQPSTARACASRSSTCSVPSPCCGRWLAF